MIAALLTLALLSGGVGAQPKHCTTACYNDGRDGEGVLSCFYDELPTCAQVCVPGEFTVCRPRSVTLFYIDRIREWDGTEVKSFVAPDPPTRGGGETSGPFVPYGL